MGFRFERQLLRQKSRNIRAVHAPAVPASRLGPGEERGIRESRPSGFRDENSRFVNFHRRPGEHRKPASP
jgi:hypothetical protein